MEHDLLPGLALFAKIVQYGSLSGAAEHSGMTRSAISKQLSALEKKLGVQLLQRSTRRLTLTEAGKHFLEEARTVAGALDDVLTLKEEIQGQASGRLVVSCSAGIGKIHLVPLLIEFNKAYPAVQIRLQLEDRIVDLIDEQIDLAIRVGHLPDSTQIARRIGQMQWVICASPEYLARRGTPEKPIDVLRHDCLYYQNSQSALNRWHFAGPHGEQTIKVDGALSINDSTALIEAARRGMGLLWVDKSEVLRELQTGELVRIFQDYSHGDAYPVYARYSARKYLPAKTRLFLDFLVKHFAPRMGVNSAHT